MRKSFLSVSVAVLLAGVQVGCGDDEGVGSGDNTIYEPAGNSPAPVLIWGNATGSPVRTYRTLHQYFADNGYLVVAANDTSTGQGESLIQALNWIERENSRQGSRYYGKADLSRVAISGHSQGGASAVVAAGKDSRIKALAALQPDCAFWVRCNNSDEIKATSLLVAGGSDSLVSSRVVEGVYRDIRQSPAVYAEIRRMSHTGWYRDQEDDMGKQILTFFDGVLNNDSAKLGQFESGRCDVCGSSWDIKSKNF